MAEREDAVERAVEALKEPARIDSGFTARVMSEIARLPAHGRQGSGAVSLLEWLRRPRTVRLSPLAGLAMAAGIAGVLLVGSRLVKPGDRPHPPAAGAATDSTQVIQFVLVAPRAASVALVGDFNDWSLSATPLVQAHGDGVWWVTVPLPPGRYRYSFVVDGTTWFRDPGATAVEDEFGRPNSVVTVGGA